MVILRGPAAGGLRGIDELLQEIVAAGSGAFLAPGRHRQFPSVTCVSILVVAFFGTYLAVVIGRLVRAGFYWSSGQTLGVSPLERRLAAAVDCFGVAPILAVLMIGTRLRAIQLDPSLQTEPELFVKRAMYAGTGALLARVLAEALLAGGPAALCCRERAQGLAVSNDGQLLVRVGWSARSTRAPLGAADKLLRGLFHGASALLYGASGVILVAGVLATQHSGEEAQPAAPEEPPTPMLWCLAIVAGAFLAEGAALEAAELLDLCRPPAPAAALAAAGPGSHETGLHTMHFPIMFCVLLVAMQLRAAQFHLHAGLWPACAMYVVAASIVGQVSCTLAATLAPAGAEQDGKPAVKWLRLGLLASLYFGVAVSLLGAFTMEVEPVAPFEEAAELLGRLAPPGFAEAPARALAEAPRAPQPGAPTAALKPLSPAMQCVMWLTAVYFAISLCLLTCSAVAGNARKWAGAVSQGVQTALAFAPMLCMLMIAVRLRALQVQKEDPQIWAQQAMFLASGAVTVQVLCSLMPAEDICNATVLIKILAIALLVIHYAAAATLLLSVGALLGAAATLA